MATWARQRKIIYISIISIVIIGVVGVPLFLTYYKAPTCFDNKMNGNEKGIDCGGSCEKICQNEFLSIPKSWARFERLTPKLYNVAAYIINPNLDGEAKNVPYHMILLDKIGMITEVKGTVTIPPHRNTIAFNSAVYVGERLPETVSFEFTGIPNWEKKTDSLAPLVIVDKNYTEDSSGSSLIVTLKNTSVRIISNILVNTVLYNKDGNAIGFSKTYVDNIDPEGTATASFTWPTNRNGEVTTIEVLPVAE